LRRTVFHGIKLVLPETVYEPAEDTELLLEALEELSPEGKLAADVGCGSGILSIYLARSFERVIGTDVNPDALLALRESASLNGVGDKVLAVCSDVISSLRVKLDLAVFNPPYLPESPRKNDLLAYSWCGGRRGREILDRFLLQAKAAVRDEGRIIFLQTERNGVAETEALLSSQGFRGEILKERKICFDRLLVWVARRSI